MVDVIEKVSIKQLFEILVGNVSPFEDIIDFIESSTYNDRKDILNYVELKIKKIYDNKEFELFNKKNCYMKFLALIELSRRIYKIDKVLDDYIYTPEDLYKKYFYLFAGNKEKVWGFYFNIKQKLLGKSLISLGSSDFAVILIKDILFEAIKYNAKGIIIIHNHPSGDISPSGADMVFTRKLKKMCKEIGFLFMDHIIVSENGYYSMNEKGDLF